MPTALLSRSGSEAIDLIEFDWGYGAFGAVVEDESREEEAAEEEVDSEGVEDAVRLLEAVQIPMSILTYSSKRKKATTRPCCARNRRDRCLFCALRSDDAVSVFASAMSKL